MAKEEKKKVKRPTAEKRMIQNTKRRMQNKSARSELRTTIRHFNDVLKTGDAAVITEKLKEVYSMLDKSVKKGVCKLNCASRQKSRFTAKAAKVSS